MADSAKKIGLIGRIDSSGMLFDGQTVKTRTIWRMLCERYGEDRIMVVDTTGYKQHPLRVLSQYLRCLRSCDDIVVSLSRNGRKFFFPLLCFASKHLNKRIYHNLIGGWLGRDVREHPKYAKYLDSFVVNWVESVKLADELNALGVKNVEYLPNFKMIEAIGSADLSKASTPPYRVCTFSRVIEQKGILEAIEAIELLNADKSGGPWELDIYGPIDDAFASDFQQALAGKPYVAYRGCVTPEMSVETIHEYWALLFPTKWELEGVPGTIIDALSAGVPIIASHWRYYDEMLADGETGYSFEFGGNVNDLVDAIGRLKSANARLMEMRQNCIKRADSYSPKRLFARMTDRIESNWV